VIADSFFSWSVTAQIQSGRLICAMSVGMFASVLLWRLIH